MKTMYKNVSLADRVYAKLERDIISGAYPRGEILTELRLVEELGVSRTPIREALRRLAQDHLIEDTGKGSRVLGITQDDLDDLLAIRVRLEGLVARYAAENRSEEEIAELRHLVELQEYYVTRGDTARVVEMDDQMHELIYRMSRHPVLYDTLEPVHRKMQKYRRESVDELARAQTSAREHRAIYEAIAARDGETADRLMSAHADNATHSILEHVHEPEKA